MTKRQISRRSMLKGTLAVGAIGGGFFGPWKEKRVWAQGRHAAGYSSPEDFKQAVLSRNAEDRFDKLMRQQLDRALGLYEAAAPLEAQITPDCRPTCWAMMRIYRGLLDKIAADPRRVLRERVRLSGFDKAMIALRATWRWKLGE